MGLTIVDVVGYFEDLAKAEEEAMNTGCCKEKVGRLNRSAHFRMSMYKNYSSF